MYFSRCEAEAGRQAICYPLESHRVSTSAHNKHHNTTTIMHTIMHTNSDQNGSPQSAIASDVTVDHLISLFQDAHLSPCLGGFLPDDKLTLELIEQAYNREFFSPPSLRVMTDYSA